MAVHISSINIIKYRGMHNLELNGLNHINLLTGNNNCGKTSVLEMISTIDNPEDIGTWAQVARSRGPFSSYYDGFYNLFPADEDAKCIIYSYTSGAGIVTETSVNAKIEKTQISEKEMYRINGLIRTGSTKRPESIIDTEAMTIGVSINRERKNEFQLYDFQTRINMFVDKEIRYFRTIYISPFAHSTQRTHITDILTNGDLYEELIRLLQEFDPSIIGINAVPISEGASGIKYVVMTRGHKNALPLSVYGDGMKKAIAIMSGLIAARGGILLLDEFETAIHTSVMDKVFTWLLENALKLNVQIFMTTHSKEAISRVLYSSERLADKINLYTLYKDNRGNMVRCLKCLEAIKADEQLGVEWR